MLRKLFYNLVDALDSRGYTAGIIEPVKNEWYDIGYEDGFNAGLAEAKNQEFIKNLRKEM